MRIELPALAYANNALEPYLSAETLDHHYSKHHRAYVDNLNKLIVGTEFETLSLADIVKKSSGPICDLCPLRQKPSTHYWSACSGGV